MSQLMLVALFVCVAGSALAAPVEDSRIRLNTIGFLPTASKRASVAAACRDFTVIRASDGAEVFTGKASEPSINADTGETLQVVDFTKVSQPGDYCLDVANVGRSAPFRIAVDVYDFPFYTVMRGMYLWRCGCAVSGTHNGQTFSHPPCHIDDAYLDYVGGGHVRKDGSKGWHDAGDYNKYTVNAGFTVGVMFQAWEQFGDKLAGVSLNLPESGNGTPDFLNELRWELEWLLTMQADDGRVYHKLTTIKFCGFIAPEAEKTDRYFTPWGSAATADFVAVMAMAARHFEPYDKAFAARCLDAAKKSYAFLVEHPEDVRPEQKAFSTGAYTCADTSRRLWAAVEMWQTTGDAACLKDFQTRARAQNPLVDNNCGWANVKNLAMYSYVLAKRSGRDPELLDAVKKSLLETADQIVKTRDAHGYARPFGTRYFWGCNGDVAQQVQTLAVANVIAPNPVYVQTSLDALGHLFGRNCFGRSFVTGLGYNPPMHPHDRRSIADSVIDPWPGYLIGGGWPKATDWHDDQENFRTNEIAINWNATLIYALAGFAQGKAR